MENILGNILTNPHQLGSFSQPSSLRLFWSNRLFDHLLLLETNYRPILVFHSYLLLSYSVSNHSIPFSNYGVFLKILDKFFFLCWLSSSYLISNIIAGYLWITSRSLVLILCRELKQLLDNSYLVSINFLLHSYYVSDTSIRNVT